MNNLLILTPIWKETLDNDEYNNITLSLSINKEYNHAFFFGKSLDLTYYHLNFPNSEFYKFDKLSFDTIEKYNLLMQSEEFYSSFLTFEYILILQTDALLVKNVSPLLKLNYDFIGSPWCNGFKIPSILVQSKYLSLLMKRIGFYKKCFIGNGGLSLRRVNLFYSLSIKHKPIKWLNEDFKFALFIEKKIITAPKLEEAKLIFFERDNHDINKLPNVYGFHAIQKYYPVLYQKLISNL